MFYLCKHTKNLFFYDASAGAGEVCNKIYENDCKIFVKPDGCIVRPTKNYTLNYKRFTACF